MAVTVEPEDHADAPAVKVYSDAPDNVAAIQEIDQWARSNGFVRTREYHLSTVIRNGQRYYQGVCWRPTEADRLGSAADLERIRGRREAMSMTAPSDWLQD